MTIPLAIAFQGAARTVTGSRHRLRFGPHAWLFDCGLYQGHRDEADRVNRSFDFAPGELEAVVVSHAHLDHTGNLPTLVRRGFGGAIHATPATADLSRPLLGDSAFLMERDLEHVNRRLSAKHQPPRQPLYRPADVVPTLERFVPHGYHEPWALAEGVTVTYGDAGHILGSALTSFEFRAGGRTLRLAMSGDLGRCRRPILRDPDVPPGPDVLVLESTYGDRRHPSEDETVRALREVVVRTIGRGGRLLVPSFAVGRTQELVATLHDLLGRGQLPEVPIFVDSPLARVATEVYRRHPECFDAETSRAFAQGGDGDGWGAPFGFPRLRYVSSPEESKALNERRESCIVIAASGMCEGGRILHHLQFGIGDPRNTLLFVGYQAEGTLGRRLQEGAEQVNIFGEPALRRCEVVSLEGFSAHADQEEILTWVGRLDPAPRRIFLVHGDPEPAGVLAGLLRERVAAEVSIPEPGEEVALWS
jgi:metallo-beta-lactamase family protein